MDSTRAPFVIDRLIELLRAHPGLPPDEVIVLDGPERYGDYRETVILVGFNPDAQQDVVTVQETRGLRVNAQEEFAIGFLVNVVNGDIDVKAARDTAKSRLDVIAEILRGKDMTLDGTCGNVKLGPSLTWRTIPTEKGVEVTVAGTVTGKALL